MADFIPATFVRLLLATGRFCARERTKLLLTLIGLLGGRVTGLYRVHRLLACCLELVARRIETQGRCLPAAYPVVIADDEWVSSDISVPVSDGEPWAGLSLGKLENTPTALPFLPGLSRVRRRALWVRRLQDLVGGRVEFVGNLLCGRWCDDLLTDSANPYAMAVRSWVTGGVAIVGGGRIRASSSAPPLVFLVTNGPQTGQRILFPELVGRLKAYTWMRPRTEELLVALRSRARDWCSDAKLPSHLWSSVISGAVLSAMEEDTSEVEAEIALRASGQFPLPSA